MAIGALLRGLPAIARTAGSSRAGKLTKDTGKFITGLDMPPHRKAGWIEKALLRGALPVGSTYVAADLLGDFGSAAYQQADPWGAIEYDQEREEAMLSFVTSQRRQTETMMRQNASNMARNNPHLFAELMFGQRLPRGATVIGGQPRGDLLDMVATMMMEAGGR